MGCVHGHMLADARVDLCALLHVLICVCGLINVQYATCVDLRSWPHGVLCMQSQSVRVACLCTCPRTYLRVMVRLCVHYTAAHTPLLQNSNLRLMHPYPPFMHFHISF